MVHGGGEHAQRRPLPAEERKKKTTTNSATNSHSFFLHSFSFSFLTRAFLCISSLSFSIFFFFTSPTHSILSFSALCSIYLVFVFSLSALYIFSLQCLSLVCRKFPVSIFLPQPVSLSLVYLSSPHLCNSFSASQCKFLHELLIRGCSRRSRHPPPSSPAPRLGQRHFIPRPTFSPLSTPVLSTGH